MGAFLHHKDVTPSSGTNQNFGDSTGARCNVILLIYHIL